MKCKVLYITRKFPPMIGGMENFSYNLYKGLSENDEVDIKLISLGKKQKNLMWFVPYALFVTLFTASRYDIIFVGDAVLSIIGFITKLFYHHKKVVVNVFGLDITYKNKFYQFYLKIFYKCFDKYISISRETDNLLHKKGNFDSIIITPGVNCSVFKVNENKWIEISKRYNISKGDTVLITVGRLVKRKGVEWFVRNVMPFFKTKSVKYLIAGTGDQESRIRETISELDLKDQVIMLGRVSDEELASLYNNADIFIMPNIPVKGDAEGFGIVAAEAGANGLIVLASGIEGIKDAIIDGENGFLLESGNADQYYKKISDIMQNCDHYRSLSKKFAGFTNDNFSWKHICGEYVKLFKELIGIHSDGES